MLLIAAKDVAKALADLINSTKNSSGKPANDPIMETLKVAAQVSSIPALIASSVSRKKRYHIFVVNAVQNK